MKILLDTHIAIWAVLDSEKLSDEARAMLLDEDNEIYYSAASVWEITIKHLTHPETFLYSGKQLESGCEANGFVSLPIYNRHSAELETLARQQGAPVHKDPFDRMLLAQAKSEGMKFMTHDSMILYYNEPFIISV